MASQAFARAGRKPAVFWLSWMRAALNPETMGYTHGQRPAIHSPMSWHHCSYLPVLLPGNLLACLLTAPFLELWWALLLVRHAVCRTCSVLSIKGQRCCRYGPALSAWLYGECGVQGNMVSHAFSLFVDEYHTQKSAALGQILDHADESFKVVPPEVYSPAVYVSVWPV